MNDDIDLEELALTRVDLDHPRRCGNPDCHVIHMFPEFYVHSNCHPKSPTWAHYKRGLLTLLCSECGQPVSVYKIAES